MKAEALSDYSDLNKLPKETKALIEGWMLCMADLILEDYKHSDEQDDYDVEEAWQTLKSELE